MRLFFSHAEIHGIHWVFVSTSRGLHSLGFALDGADAALGRVRRRHGKAVFDEHDEIHRPLVEQIREYFTGKRRQFSIPLDVQGTPFQKTVWNAIQGIPYGETRSYRDLAAIVGRSRAARAVGQAAAANPLPLLIPCHRVIGSSGKLCGFSSGLALKERLLALERTYLGPVTK